MPEFLHLMASFFASSFGILVVILVVGVAIHEYRSTK